VNVLHTPRKTQPIVCGMKWHVFVPMCNLSSMSECARCAPKPMQHVWQPLPASASAMLSLLRSDLGWPLRRPITSAPFMQLLLSWQQRVKPLAPPLRRQRDNWLRCMLTLQQHAMLHILHPLTQVAVWLRRSLTSLLHTIKRVWKQSKPIDS
jgi:hypothetical protein